MTESHSNHEKIIRFLKIVGIILICGIGLVYAVYNVQYTIQVVEGYTYDEEHYIKMAQRILEEHYYSFWGYGPDAHVSPGFPLFLAACMKLFGTGLQGINSIRFVQAGLFTATVLLTFLLAWLLTKKYSISILAAALIALNGAYPYYCGRLLTEILFCFTMMLFFVVFVLAVQKEKKWLYLLSGILFCVTIFVRPLLIIIAPALCIPLILKYRKQWKTSMGFILMFALGIIVVGLPWWIRNLLSMDKFILLATQTNPLFAGLAEDPVAMGLTDPKSFLGNIKLLIELLVTYPTRTIYWMLLEKFDIIFMSRIDYVVQLKTIADLIKDITVYFGLLGAVRSLFSRKLLWPAVVFFLFFFSTFLFVPVPRYALQYLPLLAIFAGYAITSLWT